MHRFLVFNPVSFDQCLQPCNHQLKSRYRTFPSIKKVPSCPFLLVCCFLCLEVICSERIIVSFPMSICVCIHVHVHMCAPSEHESLHLLS